MGYLTSQCRRRRMSWMPWTWRLCSSLPLPAESVVTAFFVLLCSEADSGRVVDGQTNSVLFDLSVWPSSMHRSEENEVHSYSCGRRQRQESGYTKTHHVLSITSTFSRGARLAGLAFCFVSLLRCRTSHLEYHTRENRSTIVIFINTDTDYRYPISIPISISPRPATAYTHTSPSFLPPEPHQAPIL